MNKKITFTLLASSLIAGTILVGQAPASAAAKQGIIEKTVNFRTNPSLNGNRIRFLKANEHVDILGKVNPYWYKIKDNSGRIGYVSSLSKFIKTYNISSVLPTQSASGSAQNVINAGKKYLGTPYEFASSRSNTRTFDCSDFVRQAFKDGANVTIPSDSRSQANFVKKIGKTTTNWRNLKPGDLMFFMDYKGLSKSNYTGINKSAQRISHVGIYLGNGKVMHTFSKESGGVRIDTIAGKHWEYRFVIGGSALK